jgi:hypothetical protein
MIITELRSLRWADLFLSALLDPRALYRQIDRKEPRSFILSFFVPAVVAAALIITVSLLSAQTPFFFIKITYGWIFLYIAIAVQLVVGSALMDMASQMFGYKGNIRDTIILNNFALFPLVFILPLVYIFRVFSFAPVFFFIFFFVCLMVWSALVAIEGLSEMHTAGFGKSVLVYMFPGLLFSATFFFMFILAVICGIGYITG